MKGKTVQIAGLVLIIAAGFFYTLERCANWIANGLSAQGRAVHSGNGSLSEPWVGATDNVFVIAFVVIGILMFLWGLRKSGLE